MNEPEKEEIGAGERQERSGRTESMTQREVDAAMRGLPGVRPGGPFYALAFRNFRLFFVGQMISVAGTWMQTVALQWLVFDLTHSAAWLGIVSGASAIPYVALTLHGGHVADHHPRRATLVITQAAAMILAFALAILDTNRIVTIQAWHIALLAALSGVVNAYNMPAQQAFVVDMVDTPEALGNAIALNSLQFNIARFLGPILAGIVLAKYGAMLCFTLNGLSYLAVIASLLLMRLRPFQPSERDTSMWEGFGYIRRNLRVFRVVSMVGAASLFAWSVSTLYPVFADRFVHPLYGMVLSKPQYDKDSAVLLSRLMSASGVGAAAGGLFIASVANRLSRRLVLYGSALGFGAGLIVFAYAPHYLLALVLLVVSSIFMVTFGISANTTVQEEVPDALRGRVMAVYSLVFGGLMPLGGLEIGFLAHRISAVHAVYVNASLFLLVTLVILSWSLAEYRSRSRLSLETD